MPSVIGVRFKNAGKLYYFDPGDLWTTAGDAVIVETARGIEYAEVVTGICEVPEDKLQTPLKKVIRTATAADALRQEEIKRSEEEAFVICRQKIEEHGLKMKLVQVEYTFDAKKLIAYFTANGRVDFRALVKDLASIFHIRIELRQIGVRDEAKMLGSLGPCGRPLCCSKFLGDFEPVSIKMAKEQNLSLNPSKISGVCGRLMCCLKFEEEFYEQTRKKMPKIGKEVLTPDGEGVVKDINILKETVNVSINFEDKEDSYETREYSIEDIKKIPSSKRQKPSNGDKEDNN
ncbi:MAG: PSP1 domain-containing protein [Christensenellales bacterium]|jgi:cell fate regulator YaaT (PSP1 superfamily)